MTRAVSFLMLCTTLVGCKAASGPTREEPKRHARVKVVERVVVDDAVIDKGDALAVIDPVSWTANISEDGRAYDESLSAFSEDQRHVFAVLSYQGEVDNGGHTQFYFNSTGIVWKDALEGYKVIGLNDAAAILELSAKRMGGAPSLDRTQRQEQLDSLKPDFEDLDDRFYKLEEKINFDEAIMAYIKTHRHAFYFEGDVEKTRRPDPR
jgi:hypothetical protein